MSSKVEATIEDFYNVEGKAELVNGEIVLLPLTGGLPHLAALQITRSLMAYADTIGKGHAIGDSATFIVNLPHRKSFSPDAAFYVGEATMKFVQGAPLFAVEVRGENEYGPRAKREMAKKEMAKKRADYFAAGTLVVWDVDLLSADVVRVYRSSEPKRATIYHRDEIAEAEPALPCWTMAVINLFRRN